MAFNLKHETTVNNRKHSLWVRTAAVIAVVFGLLTIKSGGSVLLIDGEARRAAGNYVNFVVWFNFIAGFFYVATGVGIWLEKIWAPAAAISIAALTLLVFTIFGIHVVYGGAYEQRTVGAMTLRSVVWILIAFIIYRSRHPQVPH